MGTEYCHNCEMLQDEIDDLLDQVQDLEHELDVTNEACEEAETLLRHAMEQMKVRTLSEFSEKIAQTFPRATDTYQADVF